MLGSPTLLAAEAVEVPAVEAVNGKAPLPLEELRTKARAAGLWAPQSPQALGGMGLSRLGMAVMYQEANRSLFGPVACNAAAPDDGNMMLLAVAGTPSQQDRWLRPIIDGKVRSVRWFANHAIFSMYRSTLINTAAVDAPESVNADAYANWLFRIKPSNPAELDALLTADAYAATL